jgi:four helix bundle protein
MDQPTPVPPARDARPDRISTFEQMKVWQEAHALVLRVFQTTPRIPQDQQEVLAALMERTAIEVPKSIAEGFKRRGSRNKAHYYNLAQSALESLRYLLILCRDLKFDVDYDDLAYRGDQVSRMLDGLVRSMARPDSSNVRHGKRRGNNGDRRPSRQSHDDSLSDNGNHNEDQDWDDDN